MSGSRSRALQVRTAAHWLAGALTGLLLWGLALLMLSAPREAAAQPAPSGPGVLELADGLPPQPAWPLIGLAYTDPAVADPAALRARGGHFEPTGLRPASLGLREDAVWLRLRLWVPAHAAETWLLDTGYAVLNEVDLFVLRDAAPGQRGDPGPDAEGEVTQHVALGNLRPDAGRPLLSRTPASALSLSPGFGHTVYLRIRSQGAMIMPVTLSRAADFHAAAMREALLQGLALGLGLCLALYGLAQWRHLGERLVSTYAILVIGSTMFSVAQFGVGRLWLWGDVLWFERHMAGLSALLAATGSSLFIAEALRDAGHGRWYRPTMHAAAGLCVAVGLAFSFDLLPLKVVSAVMSVMGLLPAALGLPGAWRLMRRGDPVGRLLLLAWASYLLATTVMIWLINGRLPVNGWTLHAFQIGAVVDMLIFMRVLSWRSRALFQSVDRTRSERDLMHSLAHTDPLTGLLNRRGLERRLGDALAAPGPFAVLLLDLDGFKRVNDQHGHAAGDRLLVTLGQRLASGVRQGDSVARLGGDEFVVLAHGVGDTRTAQGLADLLAQRLREPVEIDTGSVVVGASVGVALAPQDGRDADTLLRLADRAMFAGKSLAGRAR